MELFLKYWALFACSLYWNRVPLVYWPCISLKKFSFYSFFEREDVYGVGSREWERERARLSSSDVLPKSAGTGVCWTWETGNSAVLPRVGSDPVLELSPLGCCLLARNWSQQMEIGTWSQELQYGFSKQWLNFCAKIILQL